MDPPRELVIKLDSLKIFLVQMYSSMHHLQGIYKEIWYILHMLI